MALVGEVERPTLRGPCYLPYSLLTGLGAATFYLLYSYLRLGRGYPLPSLRLGSRSEGNLTSSVGILRIEGSG